ncbi:hypothetical protein [Natronorubrum texcoconense]|uniref:Uncharacterized protein n=1 Tax=Natronorubrum texcoconense TaxID=1095776 RepID=A0A1G8Y3E2_9EURY|nr:hypothetical protein [Natronorubrum texcoconense]SDJ96954.1 hypothetical protein SAMN04515672_1998 [Natronorubrum texcoconense]
MFETASNTHPRYENEQSGPASVDTQLYALIALATVFGIGHHVDHVVRGNHVGWPLIPEVTVFTYTLAVYPLIAVGLYLTLTERVGAGYWAVLLGTLCLVVTVVHFGPWAIEPPQDVLGPYENVFVGYGALAWLLGFVGTLLVATGYAVYRWQTTRSIATR